MIEDQSYTSGLGMPLHHTLFQTACRRSGCSFLLPFRHKQLANGMPAQHVNAGMSFLVPSASQGSVPGFPSHLMQAPAWF